MFSKQFIEELIEGIDLVSLSLVGSARRSKRTRDIDLVVITKNEISRKKIESKAISLGVQIFRPDVTSNTFYPLKERNNINLKIFTLDEFRKIKHVHMDNLRIVWSLQEVNLAGKPLAELVKPSFPKSLKDKAAELKGLRRKELFWVLGTQLLMEGTMKLEELEDLSKDLKRGFQVLAEYGVN
ncbi:hypothetical protein IPA_07205 [Ignicoccus pacificus DSM 13166]|uniref:Uncharacterized protein n=1 Tax=Ignicoccus pacificus DSM 13166 TaxID=940294 RepID=A0A977KBL7_9CREN|nr:hypothetical protein IPA_07205 [Ignicoccus pacificus DSM 13166]